MSPLERQTTHAFRITEAPINNMVMLPDIQTFIVEHGNQQRVDENEQETITDLIADVVEKYREFHNLEPRGESSWAHNMLTDELYPSSMLPVLATIAQTAEKRGDEGMMQTTTDSLQQLDATLTQLDTNAKANSITRKQAFLRMRSDVLRGKGEAFHSFTMGMRTARESAYRLIKHMPDGYISHNPSITIQNGRKTLGAFDTIREKALAEYEQAEYGLDLGLDFATKLHDPKTKVVVFSIDINSTINDRETAANTALLDKTLAELQFMAEEMKTTYGDKKAVLLVLNTGRPALYAWGTAEMLPPIPELRVFGMAEAGGVVFKIEDTQLKAETPVEDPQAWFDELQRINHHLQEKINGTARTEPKLSMLSMELANREGGTFIHETTDGEIVTPEWIANEVTTYLQQTHDQLEQELEIVANRMTKVPDVTDFINQLKKSRLDGNTAQTRDYLQQVLQEEEQELQDRLEAAITSLHTIDIMKASLTCSFNPTAGFIDIGNKNFNKFSTLLGEVKKIGFTYEEALIVHIGDSSTDNPPVDNLEPGQPNEGVDSIYLVAVGNSTQKLKNAAQIRGEKGRITARDAILGLDDTIKGIQRALKQYPVAA